MLLAASLLLLGTAATPVTSAARSRALVKIVKAPPARTGNTKAVFRFKRAKAARTWCRIDRRRYRRCRVRAMYAGVGPGRHTFRVHARRNGRTSIARRSWTVVAAGASPQSGGKLRFADEFNGTTLDEKNWGAWNTPGNRGIGLRRRSAFSLSNGMLVVTARMINGQIVSGGMAHRANYKYGRYEFRVRTERDPARTMSGVVMTWPYAQRSPEFTENDMYETGPGAARDRFNTFIHYGRGVTTQAIHRHHVDATQWHTIVMDWRAKSLKLYRDGRRVWTLTDATKIPDVVHHMGIQFDPFYTYKLKGPVRMYVDYVRIYE